MDWSVFAAGAAAVLAYMIGSSVTVENGSDWYQRLNRPNWQPPNWVFGVAWPYHFTLLTVAMWQFAQSDSARAWSAICWFACSVATALLWSYLFYIRRSLWPAAVALVATVCLTPPFMVAVFATSKLTGWLLLPYQIWLAVAASLAVGYAKLN